MIASVDFLGQVFSLHDLFIVGLLIVLEGVLSIDNALVLGLLAKRLPKSQQARALTYGLVGAFVFRLIAICTAGLLMKWRVVKLLGGGYLVYVAVRHLFFESRGEVSDSVSATDEGEPVLLDAQTGEELRPDQQGVEIDQRVPVDLPIRRGAESGKAPFWPTVLVIELTDIAFAVDSILAAIALVVGATHEQVKGSFHPKLWVVLLGGMLGVILMRFAAVVFIRLLERFPRFEEAAYLLVIVIGGKLLVDWYFNTPDHPHQVDFHRWTHPAFWVFWGLMLAAFLVGFLPSRRQHHSAAAKT